MAARAIPFLALTLLLAGCPNDPGPSNGSTFGSDIGPNTFGGDGNFTTGTTTSGSGSNQLDGRDAFPVASSSAQLLDGGMRVLMADTSTACAPTIQGNKVVEIRLRTADGGVPTFGSYPLDGGSTLTLSQMDFGTRVNVVSAMDGLVTVNQVTNDIVSGNFVATVGGDDGGTRSLSGMFAAGRCF